MKTAEEKSGQEQDMEFLKKLIEEKFGKIEERIDHLEATANALMEAQQVPLVEKGGWEPWKRKDYPTWCQKQDWFVVTPKTSDEHQMVTGGKGTTGRLIIPRRRGIPMEVPRDVMESMMQTNSIVPGGVIPERKAKEED